MAGTEARPTDGFVSDETENGISYFKTDFFVILNEVKDINLLKMRDSSLRSE